MPWNKGEKREATWVMRARDREAALGLRTGGAPCMVAGIMADAAGPFMRVEREKAGGTARHYVVHVRDPKFAVEMSPDADAPDKVGAGVIKRVCVPNSWAGQYSQYAVLLKAAQDFFRQSLLTEPVAKPETRRLKF